MTSSLIASRPRAPGFWVAILALCALLTALCASTIDGASIKGDATENLKLSYNLFHHGAFSLDSRLPESRPTNFREPLAPLVTAAYLKLVMPGGERNFDAWHFGRYTRLIKMGNLVWVFAGHCCVALLAWRLTRSRLAVLLALGLSFFFYFDNENVTNSMYTELPASVVMMISVLITLLAIDTQRRVHAVAAGVALGLLTLTKAAFLVGAPAALILIGVWLSWRQRVAQPLTRTVLPALLAFAAVVSPWMIRNQIALGTSEISSGRAGYVMYKRALMDRMPDETFRLAFYVWGPALYRDAVQGTSLAPLPGDRERGGRVQWLNPLDSSSFHLEDKRAIGMGRPDLSFTYYRKSAATFQMVKKMMVEAGHPQPDLAADKALQQAAKALMLADPAAHLKVSLVIFWRSFWWNPSHMDNPLPGFPDIGRRPIEVITLFSGVSLFAAFIAALFMRKADDLVVWSLPVIMMGIHTLLTQGLPRFTIPAIPFMLLALAVLTHRGVARLRQGRHTEDSH
jgi:hypothetical protein